MKPQDIDIELPPLPEPYGYFDNASPGWSNRQVRDAQCAAIEADRKRRGEPVAWMTHHDEPMLFPTQKEAAAYCEDDEMPIPLFPSSVATSQPSGNAGEDERTAFFDGAHVASQPAEPAKKKDWNVELSSWSDEDFVQVFHERTETTSEHIARDIREGRFPKKSERQTVPAEPVVLVKSNVTPLKVYTSQETVGKRPAYTVTAAYRNLEDAKLVYEFAMGRLRR